MEIVLVKVCYAIVHRPFAAAARASYSVFATCALRNSSTPLFSFPRDAQALAALPDPDFLLAMYLVPANLHSTENVIALVELERLLQTAQFTAFWTATKVASTRALLDSVVGFDVAVRDFIARIIARTYQKIDSEAFGADIDVVRGPSLCGH